jgi:hypothetical protein
MAKTYRSKRLRKRFESGWKPNPQQLFREAMIKNGQKIAELSNILLKESSRSEFIEGDACETKKLFSENSFGKVDLIVTSPTIHQCTRLFQKL